MGGERSAKIPQEIQEDPKPPKKPEVTKPIKSEKKGNVVHVNDMLQRVHERIDGLAGDIEKDFKDEREAQLRAKSAKPKGHFICRNEYWDLWFQKLFAQSISVKIWIIALITVLLAAKLITSIQFAAILGTIVALKGGFQVASVFRKNGDNGKVSAMDKT